MTRALSQLIIIRSLSEYENVYGDNSLKTVSPGNGSPSSDIRRLRRSNMEQSSIAGKASLLRRM